MCGIIARVGTGPGLSELLTGLKNLEYRGYDSAGIALQNGAGLEIKKCEGSVEDLEERIGTLDGELGIGHTRWSTHGKPTDRNAHPHADCRDQIAIAHNGIINNHEALREELRVNGHRLKSETDTEVIPHLLEEALEDGLDPVAALQSTADRIDGSYAVVVLVAGDDALYATRHGSPLVLGVGEGRYYLASDVPAFLNFTDRAVYLEDGDIVSVGIEGYRIVDGQGTAVDRAENRIEWTASDAEKGDFDHYMLKEIHEQPQALRQTVGDRCPGDGKLSLDTLSASTFQGLRNVQLIACGTSYHAALQGRYLLTSMGVPAEAHLASEYVEETPPVDGNTLVIGVTQSGETADTIEAVRRARAGGARTLAVTNAPGSSIVQKCDDVVFIRAGPEIGVAATKTFSSQVATLVLLAERIARAVNETGHPEFAEMAESLHALRADVQQVLDTSEAEELVRSLHGSEAYFFTGRGPAYPIALEGALKFKEITYEHAEGFAAGEFKHGPLALVNADTPVFAVVLRPDNEKTLNNVREIQARDAPVIAVTSDAATDAISVADAALTFPATHQAVAAILANVQLQLVSYHRAKVLSRPIDKPRNLAKSVTVE